MIGPMMFVYLTAHYGWRTCFLLTVSSGLVVLVLWFFTKTPPPPQDDDDPNAITLTWTQVAAYRQT